LDNDDSKELQKLIEAMQSGLVELFEQLGELRKQLELIPDTPSESKPKAYPLFSEVTPTDKEETAEEAVHETSSDITITEDITEEKATEPVATEPEPPPTEPQTDASDMAAASVNARVSRVLDPIAHELRTGEASAEILLEYLQSAKEYLIDDDERKARVARDMDIVLKFLRARGSRGIRDDERDNILKRMNRWKAHLVAYASSPAK
jgi:hypothetical protein